MIWALRATVRPNTARSAVLPCFVSSSYPLGTHEE
jgi:hypothetical protein